MRAQSLATGVWWCCGFCVVLTGVRLVKRFVAGVCGGRQQWREGSVSGRCKQL